MALTPAQIEMRRRGIGSSEIGAVAGLNKWRGPFSVYTAKVPMETVQLEGESPADRYYEKERTEAMEVGDVVEDAVAELYARRTGRKLRKCGTIVDPDHAWKMATPDRLILNTEEILEIKVVGVYQMHEWGDGEDEVPPDYRAQVEWELAVSRRQAAMVAALMGTQLRMYRIERDEELAQQLHDVGERFWFGNVVPRVPPPPDQTAGAYMRARFPRETIERPIEATPEADAIAIELLRAKEQAKELESVIERCSNQLKAVIGDAVGVEQKDVWRATWKLTKSNGVDWAALVEDVRVSLGVLAIEHPELADELRGIAAKDAYDALVAKHTRPGYRRFLCEAIDPRKAAKRKAKG